MTSDSVSDRLAVSDVLDAYARALDNKDWDGVAGVFSPDAELDYTAFGGPKGGLDGFVSWLQATVGGFAMTQHHITNRVITVDGDEATVEAELFAPLGMPAGEERMTMLLTGGRYRDTLRRTADGWRITNRVCDRAWISPGGEASGPGRPA